VTATKLYDRLTGIGVLNRHTEVYIVTVGDGRVTIVGFGLVSEWYVPGKFREFGDARKFDARGPCGRRDERASDSLAGAT